MSGVWRGDGKVWRVACGVCDWPLFLSLGDLPEYIQRWVVGEFLKPEPTRSFS